MGTSPQPVKGVDFGEAIRRCLKEKYACFKGRASRSEFWYFFLFLLLVSLGLFPLWSLCGGLLEKAGIFGIILLIIYAIVMFPNLLPRRSTGCSWGCSLLLFLPIGILLGGLIYVIAALALFVPSLAVTVRRLHDSGKSGWWCMIAFIPYLGALILLILMLLPSDLTPNKYGPVP